MRRLAVLVVLILCACDGAAGSGPNAIAGATLDAQQAAEQSARQTQLAYSQTQAAGNDAVQATAHAQSVQQTADAWQATAAADSAIAQAMRARALADEAKADAERDLAAATRTAIPVQATQAAQATATAVYSQKQADNRDWWFWVVVETFAGLFIGAALFVLGLFLWRLAETGHKLIDFKARAHAVRELKNGGVLDLTTGRPQFILAPTRPGLPTGLPMVMEAEQAHGVDGLIYDSDFVEFIDRCAELMPEKWEAKKIPSARKMYEVYQYSGDVWDKFVKLGKQGGWLLTDNGGTYITEGRTLWDLSRWAGGLPRPLSG